MKFESVKANLEKRGYAVSCFESVEDAVLYLDAQIDGKSVGMGGSMTLDAIGIYDRLITHNEVHWHQKQGRDAIAAASTAEIYFSSVNGLAESGEIINIDGNCNRVASILYGHQKVYLVIGENKLAKDYEAALWRARNIAAPKNAQRLGRKTPCALRGDRCYDCNSPERICRALTVLWEKPSAEDMEIILIGETLGY
ncbi:MAG: lactate utilization protein [Clostridia bacterium]|nr:lactate utilization protein [Clostridia bacterium]